MVTFTANKALGLPAVGGDTGAWGPPLNNNSSVLDASLGGSVTIPLSSVAGALTLLASNYNNVFITFTGALTQTTAVTFPAIGSFYTVQNLTTNNQFAVIIQVSGVGGTRQIGLPPGDQQDIMTIAATGPYFRNLPRIGTYWDYSGSSSPVWNDASIPAPWLNCDGTAFSSATYPYLATILGSATLPDARGRVRAALNQTTGRLNSSNGVDGNTLLAGGGSQATTLSSLHLPQLIDPGHLHNVFGAQQGAGAGQITQLANVANAIPTSSATTGITYGSSSQIGTPVVQPTYIGGLTLIRAG